MWKQVEKEEFRKGFNVRSAKLFSSYTDCINDYAESVFSMDGENQTHRTVHHNGIMKEPMYFIWV